MYLTFMCILGFQTQAPMLAQQVLLTEPLSRLKPSLAEHVRNRRWEFGHRVLGAAEVSGVFLACLNGIAAD